MRTVVPDIDASSPIIKKRLPITLATKPVNTQPIITFVTRAELTKWAEVRRWGPGNRTVLAQWPARVPMLPGDEDVADTYGVLSAAGMGRGRPRPMNDMGIAACCLTHGLPPATLNVKDFDDFRIHHGLELITA